MLSGRLQVTDPGPGPCGPGGMLTASVEVLPRNFLGGLSRSPAAGSTTQRSSTSLGDRAAQLEGGIGTSPLEQGTPGAPGTTPALLPSPTTGHLFLARPLKGKVPLAHIWTLSAKVTPKTLQPGQEGRGEERRSRSKTVGGGSR